MDMEEDLLRDITYRDGVIVIGTVKKIDDLRHRCKEFSLELRFQKVLHDEFVRQSWSDFFTVAKGCRRALFLLGPRRSEANEADNRYDENSPATSALR